MSLRGGPAPPANRGNAHARDARAGSGLPVKLPVSETAAETASLSARTAAIEWPILDQRRLRAVASTSQDALVWAGRTAAHLRALNHRQAHGPQAEHRLRATSQCAEPQMPVLSACVFFFIAQHSIVLQAVCVS